MKRKEKESLKTKSVDELTKLASELEEKLMVNSIKRHTEAPKNSRENRSLAQKIAIIKSYIRLMRMGGKT